MSLALSTAAARFAVEVAPVASLRLVVVVKFALLAQCLASTACDQYAREASLGRARTCSQPAAAGKEAGKLQPEADRPSN